MCEVVILGRSTAELELLRPLLADSPYKPYRHLGGLSRRDIVGFWLDTVVEQGQCGSVTACVRDGRIAGFAVLNELMWESSVIGRRIWGIEQLVVAPGESDGGHILDLLVARALSLAADQHADTVHCKRFTDDMTACHTLERNGFRLVDTQLVYGRGLGDVATESSSPGHETGRLTIRLADRTDVGDLVQVARASFKDFFGRFHSDHRLPPGAASKIYEEWIRSSLDGYADHVVLAEEDGVVAACSIWRKPSAREAKLSIRVGHYSLGMVHPDFQRRGLFTAVTRRGLQLLEGAADYAVGPTHVNNHGVQRGYARLGWQIVDATHTFHAWLR